jgi:geranylgeranyl pyrophosphate synthase
VKKISGYGHNMINKINTTIKYYFPRKANSNFYKLFNIDKNYPAEVLEKGLLTPFWDFMDRGGKRLRVMLFIYVFNSLNNEDTKKYLPLGIIAEIIHNASLMVDDIEDNSDVRRGKACLHKIYGTDIAINLGNFLYFTPNVILEKNKINLSNDQYKKIKMLIDREMINIHLGQNFDIVGHKGIIDIVNFSEEHYKILVLNKTGCMIRLAMQIAGVLANANSQIVDKLGELGSNISMIFQITDDLINLTGDEKIYGKEIGGDISEAKITLMIIHAFKHTNEHDKNNLLRILSIHTKVQDTIFEAINILKKYNSIEYAEEYCKKLLVESHELIKSINFTNEPKELIDAINKMIYRKK